MSCLYCHYHQRGDISLFDIVSLVSIQIPFLRKIVMASRMGYIWLLYSSTPCNDRCSCVVWMPISMSTYILRYLAFNVVVVLKSTLTSIVHAMVGSKHIACLSVMPIKFLYEVDNFLDTFVHMSNIVHVFFRVRSESMSIRIEAKQMQEEHILLSFQQRIQLFIVSGVSEQILDMIKYPCIQI